MHKLKALQALIQYASEQMKLHSIEANVEPANNASTKLLREMIL